MYELLKIMFWHFEDRVFKRFIVKVISPQIVCEIDIDNYVKAM